MDATNFEELNGKIIVYARGDWNLGNIREIESLFGEILEKNPSIIAINCKELDALDSTAIASFVKLLRKSREYDINLIFYDLNLNIKHTFELMTLDKFFTILSREKFEQEFGSSGT
ncbi:MAG: anti-sigma factor antagonist [Chrysiogenales bacterium]|nr:MAG: anti-sigma factor antagonist [Chrysiogenales bacterium]